MEPYTTTRIWRKTRNNLKLLAALTHADMVAVLDRLVADALKKEMDEHPLPICSNREEL
jgi:hypothetical protein